MFSFLLLILICIIAFFKPRIGLVLFLVLHASLFYLGTRFSTISFGFGYLGTGDILPAVIFLATIIIARQNKLYLSKDVITKRIMQILFIYIAWSCIGLLAGIIYSGQLQQIKFALRYFVAGVMYWGFFYVAFVFNEGKITPKRILIALAVSVAVLDLIIKVGDLRYLMLPAYVTPNLDEYPWLAAYREMQALYGWFRSIPQGHGAIELVGIYLIMYLLCNQLTKSRNWMYAVGAILCLLTHIVSVTRSSMVAIISTIFLCLIIIYFFFPEYKKIALKKAAGLTGILLIGLAIIIIVTPSFINLTKHNVIERFQSLKDEIAFIDPLTGPRGWDNAASINAITDSPILGVGYSRYPDIYNIRPDYTASPTDIMPILKVGLVCGIPGILLAIWLLIFITTATLHIARRNIKYFGIFMPYFAVFLMALIKSFSGAGAFLEGIPLVVYALFLGFFLADWHKVLNLQRTENCH